MTLYDNWADIYDIVYSYVRDDIQFYVERAQQCDGPVLELGCGTGRVTIPVAAAGCEIVGIDNSVAMLDLAKQKAANAGVQPVLELGDMRDFALDRQFPLVIIPFRSFLGLMAIEDQIAALDRIKCHLAPGGKLIFSAFVPELHRLGDDEDSTYHLRDLTDPQTGSRSVLSQQTAVDSYNQVIAVRLSLEQLDFKGEVVRKSYHEYEMRYAYRYELDHLLARGGVEVVDRYGSFDSEEFGPESDEMIWVARAL